MDAPLRQFMLVTVALAVVGASGVGAVSAGILSAEVTGPAEATTANGMSYVWAEEPAELTVRVGAPVFENPNPEYRHYDVRVTEERIDYFGPGAESLGETTVTLEELGSETVSIELDPETFSETGTTTVYVGLYPGRGSTLWTGTPVEVQVIRKTGDMDGDGLRNSKEIGGVTSFLDADTDDDGLQDGPEITRFDTDPLVEDTDDDGILDPYEIRNGTDPRDSDTDSDGLSDRREILELPTDPTTADTDDDGVADARELEIGTDPTDPDTDGDGITDGRELELGTDPTAADTIRDVFDDGERIHDSTESNTTGETVVEGQQASDLEGDQSNGVPSQPGDTTTEKQVDNEPNEDGPNVNSKDESNGLISRVASPLESGVLVPFVVIAGAIGLRRLVAWVQYP